MLFNNSSCSHYCHNFTCYRDFETSPIEGMMMFFEGFVALFMLARHKKVLQSFSEHLEGFNVSVVMALYV